MAATLNHKPHSAALTPDEFAPLMERLNPFEKSPVIAIALSGGIDSMALSLLAHDWVRSKGGKLVALTVDHGLRAESRQEALYTGQWCATQAIEHHILPWNPPALTCAIQAQARHARYALLAQWCLDHGILHLLSAHHLNDQVETLFMRLASGSTIKGLACMPMQSDVHGIRLLRPLLSIAKSRLRATLEYTNQRWLEDPSNQSPNYTRNRIRSIMAASKSITEQGKQIVQKMATVRNKLENKEASYLTNAVSLFPGGYGLLHLAAFAQLPTLLALSLLSNVIQTLTGDHYTARSEKIERLHAQMSGNPIQKKQNLAGLLFIHQPKHARFLICREPKAVELAKQLPKSSPILWDKRFRLSWCNPKSDNTPITIKALGVDGVKCLQDFLPVAPVSLEKSVLYTLPSFWRLEELIAVPHIHYVKSGFEERCFAARFYPAKSLAAGAFFSMNT